MGRKAQTAWWIVDTGFLAIGFGLVLYGDGATCYDVSRVLYGKRYAVFVLFLAEIDTPSFGTVFPLVRFRIRDICGSFDLQIAGPEFLLLCCLVPIIIDVTLPLIFKQTQMLC